MPSEFQNPICITRFKGMFSLFDAALIGDNYLANSLNISCADFGITPFKMYSAFANQLTGDDYVGRIISSDHCKTSAGADIPWRLRDDGSTCTLEWYNSVANEWETLLASLTTNVPMAFVDYNTATQDGAFFSNGVMYYSFWKKSVGSVASNTSTVITLNETAATQGFANGSGTVIVNGVEYTYTGTSGKTITGLTGLPTFDVDEGVAEAIDDSTYSTQPKFTMMGVADGRVWGAINTSVRLYYSQVGVGTNFTASTTPDDPGTRDFIEGEGAITGLGFIKENVIVFKPDIVTLYKLDYPSATTRISISKTLRRGDSQGAVNQDGIVTVGEQIFYMTSKGGVKSISLSKLTDEFDFNDETEIVRPSLKDGVFTSTRGVYWEKEKVLLYSYKTDSDSSYNDRCVVIEFTKENDNSIFKPIGFLDWQVGSWFKYSGDLYFGGSYEPNCFKAFDGYQKGTADAPFTALFTTKRYRFSENPILQKEISYIALDGWILHNKLKIQVSYNYLGSLSTKEYTFDPLVNTAFVVQPDVNTIGAFEMGSEPIGGLLTDIDDLNYFRFFIELPTSLQPTDIQVTGWSDEVGSRWKLNSISFLVKDAGLAIPQKLKLGINP